ncbi:MAG: translesion DNA synthesis-associated protein ImuA [Gammaproteobacteria bacterium]
MLSELLQRADLWRGRHTAPHSRRPVLPTGYAPLDQQLPGGGWPVGALTEILYPRPGVGELQLTLPALRQLGESERWLAWVDPPHVPYAPALAQHGLNLAQLLWLHTRTAKEQLWALEQTLRSGICGAVLGWPGSVNDRALRRLQLAAEHGEAVAFLFRPRGLADTPSPAALRLAVERQGDDVMVRLLKTRGQWADGLIRLPDPAPRPAASSTSFDEARHETAAP